MCARSRSRGSACCAIMSAQGLNEREYQAIAAKNILPRVRGEGDRPQGGGGVLRPKYPLHRASNGPPSPATAGEDFEHMTKLSRACNIDDLAALAKARLPKGLYDYIERGAEDEITLRANSDSIKRVL